MPDKLASKHCVPCSGSIPALSPGEVDRLLREIDEWALLTEPHRLSRRFTFGDFVSAMGFVNRVAELAEAEGHHPDIVVHYNQVTLDIWTHAISGLSESDFVLAAKVSELLENRHQGHGA
ncbi:MAG: 4a-hydroxytetrahydrobiopterin dehydratase [Candidatus Sericytochromatia bacterium]|nr:4a-hydroxytetrahydrobiopterin dehydratase [Candidatus Sericytochromatia bacterium]